LFLESTRIVAEGLVLGYVLISASRSQVLGR
jgi:hypothetical protein